MDELIIYKIVLIVMFVTAPIVFLYLLFFPAPYGRYARQGLRMRIPCALGWFVMELPAAMVMLYFFLTGPKLTIVYCFLILWEIHYINRAFIFPLRLPNLFKPMPILIPIMGIIFNIINGYTNGMALTRIYVYPLSWAYDPRFILGSLIFFTGFFINQHADDILLKLRKSNQADYQIPVGGLYRWISCPNYFGEIIEWGGWALATWSLAGFAFFIWTMANLIPRALAHHKWYLKTFAHYPKNRNVLIPIFL